MKEFKIKPDQIEKTGKKLFWILTPFALVAIGIELYYFSQVWQFRQAGGNFMDYWPLIVIALVGVYFGTSIFRNVKRQKKALSNYRIFLDDEQITLQRSANFTHTISFMEIREITKTPKGNFIVKGEGNGNYILIPSKIEDYEELESRLEKLGTIQPSKYNWVRKSRLLLLVAFVGAMIAFTTADNKWVIGITGPLVIAGLIALLYYRLVDKTIPFKTKRASWWLLAGIALFIYLLIDKLSA